MTEGSRLQFQAVPCLSFFFVCSSLKPQPCFFFFRRPAACLESRRAEKWDLCSRSEFSPKWLQLSAAHCLTYHMCKFDISDSWIAVLWNWHALNHTPSSYISLAWEIWNGTSRKAGSHPPPPKRNKKHKSRVEPFLQSPFILSTANLRSLCKGGTPLQSLSLIFYM